MAKNRERARERKERLRRENVPGELEHASGEVDEAHASIVAGGAPPTGPAQPGQPVVGEPTDLSEQELAERAEAAPERDEALLEEAPEDREPPAGATVGAASAAELDRAEGGAPTQGRGGWRFAQFIRACWAELQRVQWPDRRQVGQATAVVIGFVIVAGAFLGFADFVAEQIVDFIL